MTESLLKTATSQEMEKSKDLKEMMSSGLHKALERDANDGVTLAESLVADATRSKATDIHIDPHREHFLVRFRVDGRLYPVAQLPRLIGESLIRSIEVNASIDQVAQPERSEGTATFGDKQRSLRVAHASTAQGPKLSLRLLESSQIHHDIRELGMDPEDERQLLEWTRNTEGLVLSVGPTGCGKTTTCYSLLNEIKQGPVNVMTLEDPVEFTIDGLTQVAIDPKDRNQPDNYADGVQHLLRHDPDALFLGEIRHQETAQAAVNASFSGHVVLSTLHSRDPAGTITLLRSLGAKDYEIAASLRIVIGQRILRKLCESCRESRQTNDAQSQALEELGVDLDQAWEANGCEQCGGTGHHGLTAVFELWQLDQADQSAILKHEDEHQLRRRMRERKVTPLVGSAIRKARDGVISLADALALR